MLQIGYKIGHLEVLTAPYKFNGRSHYLTRCVCGREKLIRVDQFEQWIIKSCGCKQREGSAESHKTHGMSTRAKVSKEYLAWGSMVQRCTNPKSKAYKWYGARGIVVCERWRNSFEDFLSDMGLCPPEMTIDRFPDNDGNYEPGNCRWATRGDQMRNTRYVRNVIVHGETMCVRDAAVKLGVPEGRIYWRVWKYGMSHQAAVDLLTPAEKQA